MPEHLRALVVILGIAVAVFLIAERPLCVASMTREDYRRRRNLWFAVTLIAFLSHNFWIYVLLCGALLAIFGSRDRNPMALFCLLIFAIPPFDVEVPGFGLINYLFTLDHVRLLTLVILLPAALRLPADDVPRGPGSRVADVLIGCYLAYLLGLQAMADSFTGIMRGAFGLFVDIWLPYYVASRALRTLQAFRELAGAFVLAAVLMGMMALFEFGRGWLLYANLDEALGLTTQFGSYLMRQEGALRPNVTANNSIALGYLIMVGIALYIYLAPLLRPRAMAVLCGAGLVVGIFAALARGPWVGAALVLVVAMGVGRGAVKRLMRVCLIGCGVFALVLVSPWGGKLVDLLPFVGTVDNVNVVYRQRLFEVSTMVLRQNPLFGSFNYIQNPLLEQMRQGQGIIDMVNSYLAVALAYGLVGLMLFVGPFFCALVNCWRSLRAVGPVHEEAERLGRALLGGMAGIMLVIATASSILHIPIVYFMMIGFCSAYAQMVYLATSAAMQTRRAQAQAEGTAAEMPAASMPAAARRGLPHRAWTR